MKTKHLLFMISISLLFVNCGNTVNIPQQSQVKKKKAIKEEVVKKVDYSLVEIKPSPNDKFFIREYTYSASDDDSKNSSRRKAIQEMKIILSEEIGTHIESSLEMNTISTNVEDYNHIRNEIKSLSVAITKLKILDEKWNGRTFYLKASVRINPEQTLELLQQSVKDKASKEDIKKLNILIANQKFKLNEINRQITLQEFINKDSNQQNGLELNLGFMINQKYTCIKVGTINKDEFFIRVSDKDNSHPLRFYINSNNVLHTENGLKLKNEAPHIYINSKKQIRLYVNNDKRYLSVADRNQFDNSLLLECVETTYWNVVK